MKIKVRVYPAFEENKTEYYAEIIIQKQEDFIEIELGPFDTKHDAQVYAKGILIEILKQK